MTHRLLLILESKTLMGVEVTQDPKSPLTVQWAASFSLPYEALASLKDQNISSRSASLVLPRSQVALKRLTVEGSTWDQIEIAVKGKLESEIPFSEEEAIWDWEFQEQKGAQATILLVAVRRDRLIAVLKACRAAGLHDLEIMVSSMALAGMALAANVSYEKSVVGVIHAGSQGFEIAVAHRGRLVFSRGTFHAVSKEAWVEEAKKSLRAYQQEFPEEFLTALVVNGEEAVDFAESLERVANLPTIVGIRHALAHGVSILSKPQRGEKALNLLAAMDRTKDGKLTPRPGWGEKWRRTALVTAAGVAVVGMIFAERTVHQVEVMEREYRTLSAQIAKEPERPWLALLNQLQRALPEDVVVSALRVTDKDEITIEFTAESFSGITAFYNRLARSSLLARPQLGTIRTVNDRNRQLHKSVLKARWSSY